MAGDPYAAAPPPAIAELTARGFELSGAGDHLGAIRKFRRAFLLAAGALEAEPALRVEICALLADVHRLTRAYRRAGCLARTALAALPEDVAYDSARLRALNVAGHAAWYDADISAALSAFSGAAQLGELTPGASAFRKSDYWSNTGLALQALDRWDTAASAQRRALDYALEDGNAELIFSARLRLSNVLQDTGSASAARAILEETRPDSGFSPHNSLRWFSAWALYNERFGDFRHAVEAYEAAIDCFDQLDGGHQEMVANLLANAADCRMTLHQHAEAADLADMLDNLVSGPHPPLAARKGALQLRAGLALHRGDLPGARRALDDLLHLCKIAIGLDTDDYAAVLVARLSLGLDLDNPAAAAGAAAAADGYLDTQDADPAHSGFLVPPLILAGRAHLASGRACVARERLQAALAIELASGRTEHLSEICLAFADALDVDGAAARAAVVLTKIALNAAISQLKGFAGIPFEFAAMHQRVAPPLDVLVARLVNLGRIAEAGQVFAALNVPGGDAHVLSKTAPPQAAKSMAAKTAPGCAYLADEWAMAAALEHLREDDTEPSARPSRAGVLEPLRERRATATTWIETLIAEDWVAPEPAHDRGVRGPALDLPDAVAHLRLLPGADRVLIDVQRGAHRASRDAGAGRAEVYRAVHDLRTAIVARSDDWRQPAERLYDLLIRPVARDIEGCDRVLLSTPGALAALPYACLLDSGTPMIDCVSPVYLGGSGSAFRGSPAGNVSGGPPRVVAAGATRYAGLPALERVKSELEAIAARYPGTTVLLDEDLTADNLRQALATPADVLHLSGHFKLAAENLSRSWFALGGNEAMPFDQLEGLACDAGIPPVVWLSACETGLAGARSRMGRGTGSSTGDGGFDSLAAVLLRSGARLVIGSLWPVSDYSTAALAEAFYAEFPERDPVAALRTAQRAMASGGDFAHPYHWAGFAAFVSNGQEVARSGGPRGKDDGVPTADHRGIPEGQST